MQYLFGTPIWTFELDNTKLLNKTLIRISPDFESASNYFDTDVPPILELKDAIEEKIKLVYDELGWVDEPLDLHGRQNAIFPKGNDTPHHHPTCYLVAVYYIKVPEDSGSIIFHDPRGSVIWKDKNARTDINWCSSRPFHKIDPKEGMLLVFPGYLVHSVETNCSNEIRLSLAISVNSVIPIMSRDS